MVFMDSQGGYCMDSQRVLMDSQERLHCSNCVEVSNMRSPFYLGGGRHDLISAEMEGAMSLFLSKRRMTRRVAWLHFSQCEEYRQPVSAQMECLMAPYL